MLVARETNYLMPSGTFLAELGISLVLFVLLVVWPFIGAVQRRQWVWALAVVLLGPLAGIMWFAIARTQQPAIQLPN